MKTLVVSFIAALWFLDRAPAQDIGIDFTGPPVPADLETVDPAIDEEPVDDPDLPFGEEEDPVSGEEPAGEETDGDVVFEDENNELAAAEEVDLVIEQEPSAPEPGLAVRVERLQTGDGVLDPSEVQIRAPFPAKLLAQVPDGWTVRKFDRAPEFIREVELAPGSTVTLSVRPHILVPKADGATVFAVNEPGYAAALGYRQDATVGAILANSIRQLDEDGLRLGDAIDQLQQLLVSLPHAESVPAEP